MYLEEINQGIQIEAARENLPNVSSDDREYDFFFEF